VYYHTILTKVFNTPIPQCAREKEVTKKTKIKQKRENKSGV